MKLYRDVVSSGHLKMPRSDSSLAVGMFYSLKDAENLERGVKHRKSAQEFILLKPVTLLLFKPCWQLAEKTFLMLKCNNLN